MWSILHDDYECQLNAISPKIDARFFLSYHKIYDILKIIDVLKYSDDIFIDFPANQINNNIMQKNKKRL